MTIAEIKRLESTRRTDVSIEEEQINRCSEKLKALFITYHKFLLPGENLSRIQLIRAIKKAVLLVEGAPF